MESTKLKRIIIIGASGHGKVVADIARLNGYSDIVFLDNNPEIKECAGYPVIGSDMRADEMDGDLFIAVGNSEVRKRFMENNQHRSFPILIHPQSVIASDVSVGEGSVVMAGAILNPGSVIGKGCIINTSSSVDHDCTVSNFCHIAVGAHLCGTVHIGECTWIGAGSTVINNIDICGDCIVGAGAVVTKDLDISGIYVGTPAHLLPPKEPFE